MIVHILIEFFGLLMMIFFRQFLKFLLDVQVLLQGKMYKLRIFFAFFSRTIAANVTFYSKNDKLANVQSFLPKKNSNYAKLDQDI